MADEVIYGQPAPFQFDLTFQAEGKAADDPVVTEELDDGDLIIEGLAANFDMDRQNEAFDSGAFDRGIKSFLENGGSLCYHHKHDQAIGRVLDLGVEEGKGLKLRARVTKQEPTSPLYHIYQGIKKGDIRGLSVGGFFKRAFKNGVRKIVDMDFTEISATPVPVGLGPQFSVVAGKALADLKVPDGVTLPSVDGDVREEDLYSLEYALETIGRVFDAIGKRQTVTN